MRKVFHGQFYYFEIMFLQMSHSNVLFPSRNWKKLKSSMSIRATQPVIFFSSVSLFLMLWTKRYTDWLAIVSMISMLFSSARILARSHFPYSANQTARREAIESCEIERQQCFDRMSPHENFIPGWFFLSNPSNLWGIFFRISSGASHFSSHEPSWNFNEFFRNQFGDHRRLI